MRRYPFIPGHLLWPGSYGFGQDQSPLNCSPPITPSFAAEANESPENRRAQGGRRPVHGASPALAARLRGLPPPPRQAHGVPEFSRRNLQWPELAIGAREDVFTRLAHHPPVSALHRNTEQAPHHRCKLGKKAPCRLLEKPVGATRDP